MSNLSAGVLAGESVVRALQEASVAAARVFRETETTFLRDELLLRERLGVLEQLLSNIDDERRLIEVQLQDARSQSSQAKKKASIVSSELSRITALLSQPLAQLEEDERKLDQQQQAFRARVQDVVQMANDLEERLLSLKNTETQLEQDEVKLFNRERDYEGAKRELVALEQDVDSRRRSLERKEESISGWMKALDAREVDLARYQQQFKDELERIEVDENAFAKTRAAPVQQLASALSQRAVMDDHGMTIDRDDTSSEEELDVADDSD